VNPLAERSIGTITVLEPQGRLVLGENPSDSLLRDRMATLLQQGRRHFAIDLVHVSHVDTSGLTTLVGAYIAVRKQNGRIVLLNAAARVRELLAVTRLNTLFEVVENEDQLRESFAATPPSRP
jgi:anti-sigma B factor antagonist